MPLVIVVIAFFLIKFFIFSLPIFLILVPVGYVFNLKKNDMVIKSKREAKMLRGVTTMSASSSTIANYITDVKLRKTYDTLHVNLAHAADDDASGETFISIEHYKVPPSNNENIVEPTELPVVFMKYKCLHFSDETLTHFIIRKTELWDECFVIIPFIENPDESLVYFYSEFNTSPTHVTKDRENYEFMYYLQEKRFEFLLDLKHFCSQQMRQQSTNQGLVKVSKENSYTLNEWLEESKKRSLTFDERSTIIWKEFTKELTRDSIIIDKHNSVGMEHR